MSKEKEQWSLKTPCDDCPFVKTTEFHTGVFKSLPKLIKAWKENGNVGHSCHKTDGRADGPINGKETPYPKHCAGFTIMMLKNKKHGPQSRGVPQHIFRAWLLKYFDAKELNYETKVYKSLTEMSKKYVEHYKKKTYVHVSYKNGDHGEFYL